MYFYFYKCIARNKAAHSISIIPLSNSSPHIFNIVPSTLYPLILNEMT